MLCLCPDCSLQWRAFEIVLSTTYEASVYELRPRKRVRA